MNLPQMIPPADEPPADEPIAEEPLQDDPPADEPTANSQSIYDTSCPATIHFKSVYLDHNPADLDAFRTVLEAEPTDGYCEKDLDNM